MFFTFWPQIPDFSLSYFFIYLIQLMPLNILNHLKISVVETELKHLNIDLSL